MSRTYDIFAFLNWKRLMCNYIILQTERWARWMKNSEFSKNWNWCCAQKRINCTAPESEDLFAAQFQGTVKRNTEMARFFLQRVCRKVNSHINMCAFAHGCGIFENWYFLQCRISRNGKKKHWNGAFLFTASLPKSKLAYQYVRVRARLRHFRKLIFSAMPHFKER